ncbi:aminotransferase class V-fold PLP-dependent enzyme [Chitinophaga nivalis]|uniref:Aminotransferase class V-fold PLP-dependent enzyme n=1 Tax=Chitinophaga nivalis TaxID=2991709 RepID=A0ABT3IGM9_9BACT|nr:aminotransferase class V-fold PLP-dependent enzyme [Chitinophaga nivalis]MCW3467191.1 aminotransferase class V-fold PLP-dependent enzyme [Chitinophaga nivalis]MCW3483117.1 aminotransferase class V-fold PLP-dependent enzyme [Chitinophaga nivalis]
MDIHQIRQDTIGLQGKLFMNSAGSSLMPKPVMAAMTNYLQEEEVWGGYEVSDKRQADIGAFYTEVANLLNTRPANIAFTYNATDAYARALSAVPFRQGDVILTTEDDYISNQIAFLALQKRFGIQLVRGTTLPNGDLDLDHFEKLVQQHRPVLVSMTHIPTNSGLVQPAEAVGKICRQYNCWYLLDACQSVGQLVVDVQAIGCDFLATTGRKFLRGPRGTGFLYVSDRVLSEGLEPLFIDMRGADWTNVNEYTIQATARRFEMWEFSYASVVGLKEAVKYANTVGIPAIYDRNQFLLQQLRRGLEIIPGMQLLDKGSQRGNILTFRLEGLDLEATKAKLQQGQIMFSVTGKSSSLIDFTKKGVDWAIRLSPHYFNTPEEIAAVCDILSR